MSASRQAVDALFQPVADVETRLRALLFGAAGSGKTTTALKIALGLVAGDAGRICLLDSERGSAAKAGRDLGAPFVHAEVAGFKGLVGRRDLVEHDPRIYIEAIKAAAERYEVVVLDSLSHAWQACLELCDAAAKRFGGNTHKAWADVTPLWRELISTILESPAHVLCTARSKTKWGEGEGRNGKPQPKALGGEPELRQGTEYEFDLLLRLDTDHTAFVEKARSVAFDGAIFERPGEQLGVDLLAWLKGGEDPMVTLVHQLSSLGLQVEQLDRWRAAQDKPPMGDLSPAQHRQVVAWLASTPSALAEVKRSRPPAEQQAARSKSNPPAARTSAAPSAERPSEQRQQPDAPHPSELKAALRERGVTDMDAVGAYAKRHGFALDEVKGARDFWLHIHSAEGGDRFALWLDERARDTQQQDRWSNKGK